MVQETQHKESEGMMNIFIKAIPIVLMAVGLIGYIIASRKPTNPPNHNTYSGGHEGLEYDDLTHYFEDIGIRFKSQ